MITFILLGKNHEIVFATIPICFLMVREFYELTENTCTIELIVLRMRLIRVIRMVITLQYVFLS